MDELLEKTKKALRSVLISAPRGVPARMIFGDYKAVMGKELPYRELGYRNIEDFIRSIPDVVRIGSGPTGEPTYYAVANAETQQIARFVAVQKKPKFKKSLAPPSTRGLPRPVVKTGVFTKKFKYGPRTPYSAPRHSNRPLIGRPGSLLPPAPHRPTPFHSHFPLFNPPPHYPPTSHSHRPPFDLSLPVLRNPLQSLPVTSRVPQRGWSMSGPGSYQPHRLVNIPPRLQQHLSRPASTGNMSQGYGRRTTSSPSRSTEAGGRSFFEKTTPSTWQPQQQKSSPADVSGSGSAWKTTPTPEPSGRGMKQMGSPTKQQQQQPKSEAFGRSHRHPSFGGPPWRHEYINAAQMTVEELAQQCKDIHRGKLVSVVGYSGGMHREKALTDEREGEKQLTFLLYFHYNWCKPVPPSVMLIFRPPFWDVRDYPDPVTLGEGAKLKVYGSFLSQFSKKKGYAEPAITVKFYERLTLACKPCMTTIISAGAQSSVSTGAQSSVSTGAQSSVSTGAQSSVSTGAQSSVSTSVQSSVSSSSHSSAHSSPWGSRSGSPSPSAPVREDGARTSPKGKGVELPRGSLQEMIFELLSKKEGGIWALRLAKEYNTFFGEEPPHDLLKKAGKMPFVDCQEYVEGNPILYLKKEHRESMKTSADKSASKDVGIGETKKTSSPFTREKDTPASKRGRSEPPRTAFAGGSAVRKPLEIPATFNFASSRHKTGWTPIPNLSSSAFQRDDRKAATPQCPKEKVFVFSARSSSAPTTPASPPPSAQSQSTWVPHPVNSSVKERPTTVLPAAAAEETSHPPPLPSTLEFGDGPEDAEIFEVLIAFISSPFSFYVQLTGEHYENFKKMEKELSNYFSKEAKQASSVEVDQLFACCWDGEDGNEWCRALVLSKQDSQKVDVMFPDYGNSETVNVEDLKELPHQFYRLPFQAIHCCLHGLTEEDDSDEVCEKFCELAEDKVCVLHIMESSGSRVSVELVDPESGEETVNSILTKTFHPLSTLAPQLPAPGSPLVDVKLTNVDEYGVISLQLVGPGLNRLQQLMTHINEACSKKPKAADFVTKVTENMICCAKFHVDNQWYRVKVLKKHAQKKTSTIVEYVDFGNVEEVERLKMRKAIDTDLFSLPFQVIKCTLDGLPPPEGQWTDDAVVVVVECLNCDDLQMEVVQPATDDTLASVRIFMKEEEAYLNDLLLAQGTYFGLPGEVIPEDTAEEREGLEYATPESSSVSSRQSLGSCSDGGSEEPLPSPGASPGSKNQTGSAGQWGEQNGKGGNSEKVELADSSVAKEVALSLDGESSDSVSGYDTAAEVLPPPQNGDRKDAKSQTGQTGKTQTDRDECPLPAASAINGSGPPATEPQRTDSSSLGIITQDHQQVAIEPQCASQHIASEPHADGALNRTSQVEVNPQTVIQPSTPVQSPNAPVPSPHTPQTPISLPRSRSPYFSPTHGTLNTSTLAPFTPPLSPHVPSSPLVPRTPSQSSSASEGMRELQYESLQPGKSVPVMVSWVASPSAFVVQLLSKLGQLEQLMAKLNNNAESSPPFPVAADVVVPGFVCSAHSGIDKRWYRAVVTELQPGEGDSPKEVSVEYLDYGGAERVALSQLRPLPSELTELPVQAIHVSLHSVRPTGSGWSVEAAKYFEELVVERQFFAIELKKMSTHSIVVLVDTSEGKDTLIHEVLIRAKYAVKVAQ